MAGRRGDRGILLRGFVDAKDSDRPHIGGIAAGLLVVLLALGALRWSQAGPRPAPSPTAPPGTVFRQMHLVEYAGGARLWDLDAQHVHFDGDAQRAVLQGIQARFWDHGRVVSRARAPRALLDTHSRDLRLVGGIHVGAEGQDSRVEAESVVWSAASHSLHAQGAVMFQQGPSMVRAPELWADPSLRKVLLGPAVRLRILIESGWR